MDTESFWDWGWGGEVLGGDRASWMVGDRPGCKLADAPRESNLGLGLGLY
ncbi:hypothetical protein NEA10_03980 [Phormidium yuhuli AB48]|uniref:Uncharacterized protein n=1 Tax=Phormidium yuhuli AB48 TaxID=2940671 RepID=A0ABY5ASU9_9CYAN|nr:hypothetical protein [Phormidium yuhuli]USR91897.1 hypothetical protein NEA10_03980 [Phormidium yuhuli AB48]